MRKVEILGVPVADLERDQLLSQAAAWGLAGERRTIFYANAHCLNLATADPDYRRMLQRADLVYADGASLGWASRFLGGPALAKLTGADWIDQYAALAGKLGLRTYFLGGREGVARRAGEKLTGRFPAFSLAGAAAGYFSAQQEAEILRDVQSTGPHVLFVGLGSPRQERWIVQHRDSLAAPVAWGVGALFDFIAGEERRTPRWMNVLGLEWLWRLAQDPSGKWRRYLLGNPAFVWRIVRQKYMG